MWTLTSQRAKRLLDFLLQVNARFLDHRCLRIAASLAFATLLALVPLFTVVFTMLSLFPVFAEWGVVLESYIYENFVPAAGDVVQENVQQFLGQTGKLTAFGLLFLMLSALMLLSTIEDAFNDIWQLQQGRRFLQRLLVYWAVLTLGPILIASSLSISSYIVALSIDNEILGFGSLSSIVLQFLPFLLEILAFVLLYVAVPNCTVRLSHALLGGLVGTVLFELAKLAFTTYVTGFDTYNVIYGALASIPLFLIWIYVSWIVVLYGAELVAQLSAGYQKTGGTRTA